MSAPRTLAAGVRERRIIFAGESVRAILAGTKTQTRRVMNPGPPDDYGVTQHPRGWRYEGVDYPANCYETCPYGVPGDRLWVRESHWRFTGCAPAPLDFVASPTSDPYQARCYDDHPELGSYRASAVALRVSSIHMPRWASRLTLELTDVRVQRLQEISEEDAKAEGAVYYSEIPAGKYGDNGTRWQMAVVPRDTDDCLTSARLAFGNAWNKINGKRAPWSSNPWVWALTFCRVSE